MAIRLGDAIVFLRGDSKPLEKDLGTAEKKTTVWTKAVGTAVGNLMSGVIAKGAEVAVGAVKGLGKEFLMLSLDSAQIEPVRKTFQNLAESIGGDATEALQQLREATRGMVADADLWQAGNKFLAMGLADSTEGAAKLAEVATQLGMAMGEDATASMENFALMMANQSIPRLDSFGISSGKVRERITELMEATEGMTREAAFNQAVMEQAAITMEKVGEQAGGAAAGMARLRAFAENLKLKAGAALQPLLDAIVGIGEALVEKYGPKIEAWLERMKGPMEDLGKALTFLVEGDFNSFFGSLSDALVALGVPQETLDKVYVFFLDVREAIQAWKDDDPAMFIHNIKEALLNFGASEETINKVERAFWWLHDTWGKVKQSFADLKQGFADWGSELKTRLQEPVEKLKEAWGNLIEALGIGQGDYQGHIGKFFVKLFSDFSVDLMEGIVKSVEDLATAIDWLAGAVTWLKETKLPNWITNPFGDEWQGLIGLAGLELPEWLIPGSPTPLELGLRGITDAMTELGQTSSVFGQGNQDNRRSFTNYGGVQVYPQAGAGNPLEQLWEMGAA